MENNLEESLQELIAHNLVINEDNIEYNWTSSKFIFYPKPSYYEKLGKTVKKDLDKSIILSNQPFELKHTYILYLEKARKSIEDIVVGIMDTDLVKTISSQLRVIKFIIDEYTRDIELSPYFIEERQSINYSISDFIQEQPKNNIKFALDLSKKDIVLLFYLLEKVGLLRIDEKLTNVQKASFIEDNFNFIEQRDGENKNEILEIKHLASELGKLKNDKKSNTKRQVKLIKRLTDVLERAELYDIE